MAYRTFLAGIIEQGYEQCGTWKLTAEYLGRSLPQLRQDIAYLAENGVCLEVDGEQLAVPKRIRRQSTPKKKAPEKPQRKKTPEKRHAASETDHRGIGTGIVEDSGAPAEANGDGRSASGGTLPSGVTGGDEA
jgi:hypothetical protein